ncbi:chaperone modulator CbpM [Maribacter sp. HTCC2170]|uniref:chaperone modulator CbpM n=1 Tax=Maribacter sp. (strain HTCC2170 / KCCM 42371) TaxID=313603 RepID=UPI00006B4870|nr:chaperone modulator CbpM [Maribacter sp. HTCC2170]EAR01749.1 hypothetical protein FB2170_14513 [Maribacter sp. HTCC2170]
MKKYEYVEVRKFCLGHGIETKFMLELHEFGLIELIHVKDLQYLALNEIAKAEKIIRLYSDLDINLEGIQVIHDLLGRLEKKQNEIIMLKNKLSNYE